MISINHHRRGGARLNVVDSLSRQQRTGGGIWSRIVVPSLMVGLEIHLPCSYDHGLGCHCEFGGELQDVIRYWAKH